MSIRSNNPGNPESHIIVCNHESQSNLPGGSCSQFGGLEIFEILKDLIEAYAGEKRILLSKVDCLGPCCLGPNLVVYPEGVWYSKVTASGAIHIFREHIIGGAIVESMRLPAEAWDGGVPAENGTNSRKDT